MKTECVLTIDDLRSVKFLVGQYGLAAVVTGLAIVALSEADDAEGSNGDIAAQYTQFADDLDSLARKIGGL